MSDNIKFGIDISRLDDTCCIAVKHGNQIGIVYNDIAKAMLNGNVPTLSIKQPWAWLIANGYKPVENRDWYSKYRGPLLIHASKEVDKAGYAFVANEFPELFDKLPAPSSIERGGIVGVAMMTDCVTKHISLWFFGKYGFVLDEATPLPFKPMKGQLGIFKSNYFGDSDGK